MPEPPLSVVYIAGAGRSGSTLLERLVGELPGVVSAGEITQIWERGFRQNQLCGCGTPFRQCAFWREVADVAFGGMEAVDALGAGELRNSLCRVRNVPALARPSLRTRRFREALARYTAVLDQLCRAIAQVSGRRIIVDSSKYPPEAYLLCTMEGLSLRVIHLVRHSNAVAYAWQKKMVRPDVHWTTAYMARYPFLKTTAGWTGFNLLIEGLARQVPYIRVRYEDLIGRPRETLTGIAGLLGIDQPRLDFLSAGGAMLPRSHTASGNPMRFEAGQVPLTLDSEWHRSAPAFQRAIVSALTSPLLRRYGY